ncbi:hypothetical protein PVAG01_09706 [Phlyctema vagabunda]|uniref:Transcription factor domain-containing protein n=1 Tax=Phlyctema vagabunda TaxID=108571 RepID=A0ABR4P843_9HELO
MPSSNLSLQSPGGVSPTSRVAHSHYVRFVNDIIRCLPPKARILASDQGLVNGRRPVVRSAVGGSRRKPSLSGKNVIKLKGEIEAPVTGHNGTGNHPGIQNEVPSSERDTNPYFSVKIHNPDGTSSSARTPRRQLTPEHQSIASEAFWGSSLSSRLNWERDSNDRSSTRYKHSDDFSSRGSSPDHCNEAYFGILEDYVGCMSIEPLRSLPIKESIRNAELFHLFTGTLSPYVASLDGKSPPTDFHNQWMPFMVQSPLSAYVAILSAAYFQATARRVDLEKSFEVMEIRVTIVSLINRYLISNKDSISDEAIVAVMSFSFNEWIYASQTLVMAHMQGLSAMLRLRGGIETIRLSTFRKMLIRTDFQMSCAYERPLFLQEDNPNDVIPELHHYAQNLDNPLLQSSTTFVELADCLGLSIQTAAILDDMRFLTTSVLSLTTLNPQGIAEFRATANFIQQKFHNLPLPSPTSQPDFIQMSIVHAAKMYTSALLNQQPFSVTCTAESLGQLWMTMWRVPLSRWKRIPGIFLWIVMIVLPFSRDRAEGRFIKSMASTSMMTVGLQDWEVTEVTMRAFKAVQCWLGGTRGVGVVPGEAIDSRQRVLELRTVEAGVPAS